MAYVPPNGGTVVLDLTGYAIRPPSVSVNIEFDPSTVGDVRQASVPSSSAFGAATLRLNTSFLRVRGGVAPPPFVRHNIEAVAQRAFPSGFTSSVVQPPLYVRWPRTLQLTGWVSNENWPGATRLKWLGGYQPPPAINTILNWGLEPYSPPPAINVVLDFGALGFGRILGATLFTQTLFGGTTVSRPLSFAPTGWRSDVFGAGSISNLRRFLSGVGLGQQLSTGLAALQNLAFGISPGGIPTAPQTGPVGQQRLPPPRVELSTRYLVVTAGVVPPSFPTPVVTTEIQFVFPGGVNSLVVGTSTASLRTRAVAPPFFVSTTFGMAMFGRTVEISPAGWESGSVLQGAAIEFRVDRISPDSGAFDPAGYGEHNVRNFWQIARPLGFATTEWNVPLVYNRNQQILVLEYMAHLGGADVTQWPPFSPVVANRNRVVQPFGWRSSRFSFTAHWIRNNADAAQPQGFDAAVWGEGTFVAYRHRELAAPGWVSSFCDPRFSVVYRTAQEVYPQSWVNQPVVGRPDPVANLNRTFQHIFPYGGSAFGTPFAAYRVRGVQVLFGAQPPNMPIPEVRRNPHPILPGVFASHAFGGVWVEERFTIIAPRSTNVPTFPRIGAATLVNRNRTVSVFPSEQTLWGTSTVFNSDSYLFEIGAGLQTIFGSALIRDRRTWLYPAQFSKPVFSVLHQIRNLIPDPPAQRSVLPHAFQSSAFGRTAITDRTIKVVSILDEPMPAPVVSRNELKIIIGITTILKFGDHAVSLLRRSVAPRAIPWPRQPITASSSDLNWVQPRVSPHTIYAPSADQATQQAKDNHPPNAPTRIDQGLANAAGQWSLGGGWPFFGRPTVTTDERIAAAVSIPSALTFGGARVDLRVRRVFPNGRNMQRFGIVVFLGVPQYVSLDAPLNGGLGSSVTFGAASVAPPPVFDPYVRPAGGVLTLWGVSRIENFNREVAPVGLPHGGNPQQGLTNPWGLPLVGFPREYVIGGLDATLWGTTWISHRVRTFAFQGWDASSFATPPNGMFFALRMRVRRINPPCIPAPVLPTSAPPTPTVSHV